MKFPLVKIIRLIVPIFFLFLSFSCSKDSDLLTEYAVADPGNKIAILNIVVDDKYDAVYGSATVLNVLDNDTFTNSDNVTIVETSTPENGTAVINDDNTITYTPTEQSTPQEETTDTFTYTTETQNDDNTVDTNVGTVTVTASEEVTYWQKKFDAESNDNDNQVDASDALAKSKSANENQEYYFLGYYVDAYVSMWQATGDNTYLDYALTLIENTMDDAVNVSVNGRTFKGWPTDPNHSQPSSYGHSLWESFMFRFVASLMRIMDRSPNLRATANYQSRYDSILNFTIENIWNKWEHNGVGNFYRINTHMASHWARIGMELYLITGEAKYKEVFDNISHGTMVNRPSNLRNQLRSNPNVPSAYTWNQNWDSGGIQDTSHAGAIVSFWVEAYETDMYWDQNDIDALISTLVNVIWPESKGDKFNENVDGTGGNAYSGRLHEWLHLGAYSQEIQDRIKSDYTGANLTYFGVQPIGIAALNARILADGKPIYPEQ